MSQEIILSPASSLDPGTPFHADAPAHAGSLERLVKRWSERDHAHLLGSPLMISTCAFVGIAAGEQYSIGPFTRDGTNPTRGAVEDHGRPPLSWSRVVEPSGPVSVRRSRSRVHAGSKGDGEQKAASPVVEFVGREADREEAPSLIIETRQLVGTGCLRELHPRVMPSQSHRGALATCRIQQPTPNRSALLNALKALPGSGWPQHDPRDHTCRQKG